LHPPSPPTACPTTPLPDALPISMITAYGSLDTAINALKSGAFDFLTKPVDLQRLRELVNSALRLSRPREEPIAEDADDPIQGASDRKSTRLNSSHVKISYAVFCL